MFAMRFVMLSGVRLRPRFGRCDSSASRYRRTIRPCSRPSAKAALCCSLIVRCRFGAAAFLAIAAVLSDPYRLHVLRRATEIGGNPASPLWRDAVREPKVQQLPPATHDEH